MKTLVITRKDQSTHTVCVDDQDAWLFAAYSWSIRTVDNCAYVSTMINRKTIHLHKMICETNLDVDHIDGNGLNNCRSNLRPATRSQNLANQRAQVGCSSQYKGVCWDRSRNRWLAYIKVNKKRKHLGRFKNEIEAAKAYDKAALEAWGNFARINFPEVLIHV